MTKKKRFAIVSLIFSALGIGLIWYETSWMVAIGVYFAIGGNNVAIYVRNSEFED